MTAPGTLGVLLYGDHVATLERRRGVLRLEYTDVARRRWGLGYPLVSVSLPVALHPHRGKVVACFFEGLLPEGQLRRTLAHDFHIAENDTFGLLGEIGRDCAGALVVQRESDGAALQRRTEDPEPISDEEVASRVASLSLFPLGVDAKVRVSLAGMQEKLLLTRLPDGWALPVGAPSTHILKPATSVLPDSVENEAFCMRLAPRVGLRAARADVVHIASTPVLVVERFDRVRLPDGEIRRVHQEDVTQALGIEAYRKYEASGGPALRRIAKLLRDWRAPVENLAELLASTAFVVIVGDADRHAKNVSVLHDEGGGIRLAPLYDVMCTRHYPSVSREPGMFVNGKRDIDEVDASDLVEEGVSWGLAEEAAEQAVLGVLQGLPGAIEAEVEDSPWVPEQLLERLRRRAEAMGAKATGRAAHASPRAVRIERADTGSPTPPVGSTAGATAGRVWVHPHRRGDGTPVRGHWRQLG